MFPAEQQEQVRVQIAGTLQGVVTQALIPTADGAAGSPRSRSCSPTTQSGT